MLNGAKKRARWEELKESPPKRVALVALGPSAYDYIRHCDRNGNRYNLFDETWTVNTFCNLIQAERLFHMDDIRVQELRAGKNERVRHMLQSMKRYKGPIVTSIPHPDYPNCEAFPLGAAIEQFGSMYFNNTMPYAVAYAMLIGVKELTFFGCDYVWPNMAEAEAGRGCLEFWIAKAQDRGIVTRIAAGSTLMDSKVLDNKIKLYGYDGFDITLEDVAPGKMALKMKAVELPTAEEIERRYYKDAPKTLEAIIGPERMKELVEKEGQEHAGA